jgi:predicted O-methyltransferase YrrM
MTPKELSDFRWRSFETLLAHVCKSINPKEVLEWGPGHSTKIILATCPDVKILTIEHQEKYYKRVNAELGSNPNVEIVCRTLSMKGGHSTGYINYPIFRLLEEGKDLKKYDLIFVDGRSRFDCIVAAKLMLKEGGVILLHDAHRGNYLPAVKSFPHHKVFKELRTAIMSDKPMDFLKSFSGEIDKKKSILESLTESKPVERKPVISSSAKKSKVLSYDDTMEDLNKRFASGDPFMYLRFGDADLFFIDDPNFSKNRRHDKNPAMASELSSAFSVEHSDYLIGCVAGGKVFASKDSRLKEIAQKFHIGKTYHSAVALQVLYMKNPEGFVKFCKDNFWGKRVLLIGGHTIARDILVRKAFNVTATIEFTDRNAYKMLDSKMIQIEKNIPKFDIVVSALGQATRVLGYRLWANGHRTQYFDVGSAVDALAGKNHLRSWIKRVPELRDKYNKAFFRK